MQVYKMYDILVDKLLTLVLDTVFLILEGIHLYFSHYKDNIANKYRRYSFILFSL